MRKWFFVPLHALIVIQLPIASLWREKTEYTASINLILVSALRNLTRKCVFFLSLEEIVTFFRILVLKV